MPENSVKSKLELISYILTLYSSVNKKKVSRIFLWFIHKSLLPEDTEPMQGNHDMRIGRGHVDGNVQEWHGFTHDTAVSHHGLLR